MRLDKFLQVSRLIKQRSLAKEACDKGRVQIDGAPAKASRDVSPGQVLRIHYAKKILEIEIREVPAGNVSKKRAPELFHIINEEKLESEPWI